MIEKPNFGSINVAFKASAKGYEEVELIGLCTDICVISNAMIIKAALPESEISVVKDCCAGVSPESHEDMSYQYNLTGSERVRTGDRRWQI